MKKGETAIINLLEPAALPQEPSAKLTSISPSPKLTPPDDPTKEDSILPPDSPNEHTAVEPEPLAPAPRKVLHTFRVEVIEFENVTLILANGGIIKKSIRPPTDPASIAPEFEAAVVGA